MAQFGDLTNNLQNLEHLSALLTSVIKETREPAVTLIIFQFCGNLSIT